MAKSVVVVLLKDEHILSSNQKENHIVSFKFSSCEKKI